MGKLLDQKEAAERLGLAPRTLANWRSAGKGPAYRKVGRSVRYDEDKLREWTEAQEVTPEAGETEQAS